MKHRTRTLPLHVLPAFDAAARHGSFRAAAEELHLTPSAISHQIRTLEEALGVKLFRRAPRGLVLSDEGRAYASTVREILERLGNDADRLANARGTKRLGISMPDFVARFFAFPRLAQFRTRNPHLELEIETSLDLSDVEGGDVDAAIRLGRGSWGELTSTLITPMVATFVASSELAAKARVLSDTSGLPVVCLKNQEVMTRASLASGGYAAAPSTMLYVDSCLGLVQAAEEGLGVAVIYHPPTQRFEPTGRLSRLSNASVAAPFSMYFVCRRSDSDRPEITALRDWVLDADWSSSNVTQNGQSARSVG